MPTNEILKEAVPAGPVAARADFQAAVRGLIEAAQRANVKQLWWVSPDYADWPLEEPAVLDALTHWARTPGTHLHWVGHDFERVRRAMPRLTRWRQNFSHMLSCRSPGEVPGADLPTLLVADHAVVLRVLDLERVRGWVSHEAGDVHRAREQVDAILQRSTDAFPAVTLGL